MQAPYDKHHKVSSFPKSHQNTYNSVKYEVIWKWNFVMLIHKVHWISLTCISGHKWEMTPWMNIIMTHQNLPESHSSSRITRPYLTSAKFFTRNNPSSIQQNAYITYSAKRQLWPSVVHLTYAIYWFAPSLKVPKVIHSAILLVLSVAVRDPRGGGYSHIWAI